MTAGSQPDVVRIVGPRWSVRSHQLRDPLTRNNIPHGFYDVTKPEGRQLLEKAGVAPADQPVVLLFDGRVLTNPPNERIAEVLGVRTRLRAVSTTSLWSAAVQPASRLRCTRRPRA